MYIFYEVNTPKVYCTIILIEYICMFLILLTINIIF